MASPKSKAKSSVNQQVKARLSAVRDFLAGRSGEAKIGDANDKATREVVAAELLAAMSGRNADEAARKNAEKASSSDTQEIPRIEPNGLIPETTTQQNHGQQPPQSAVGADAVEQERSESSEEQERARKLFLDHGYFDEAVQNLRAAESPVERASAARALGLYGSKRGTPHLIAAMFDDDPEVCAAAEKALDQIGDPTIAQASVVVNESEEANEVRLGEPSVGHPDGRIQSDTNASEANNEQANAAIETVEDNSASVEIENLVQQTGDSPADEIAISSAPTEEENQLLLEEQGIRDTVEQLGQQILETTAALKEAENEVRLRIERESTLRSEAAERRREEEELRKQADEETETRRSEEQEAVAVEQAARVKAESDAQRHADEQTNIRLKAARLRLAAEELARRRADMETVRQEAMQAARQAEAVRERDAAKSKHEAELKRLRSEEEALETVTNEVAIQQANIRSARAKAASDIGRWKKEQAAAEAALREKAQRMRSEAEERNSHAEEQLRMQLEELRHADEEVAARRAEVEAARAKADAEAERLVEAQSRMRVAEEARAQAETERLQLEAEINQQVETQLRLLEEAKHRGVEEQERLQEETRRHAEVETTRLAQVETMKAKAEVESRQRAEKEQQILSQIDSLRIADAETRKRIEDAEVRRRSADEAYRLVAEKVQRVEAEAHARAKEEERILAKLEAERRTVAVEAQSRAEQEKRIKDEIEMFRRLEEQERPRIEEAILQRTEAEARLQQRQDRFKAEEEARVLAEATLKVIGQNQDLSAERAGDASASRISPAADETSRASGRSAALDENVQPAAEGDGIDELASVPHPAIGTYLNSVDPYKRAAAVAELARSGAPDAFSQIVECFDDHSPHVRNAAARALPKLEPDRTVDLFNRALEEASPNRRRNIGGAIAASGLATEAINNLASENRENTYTALSILFVMAKTGEIEPLVRAMEEHKTDEIGRAVKKLLTLSGQQVKQ